MKDALIKWFMHLNALRLRVTMGRVGSRLGVQTILLLETIGRKSGQARVIPIAYFLYEGKYLIVESNWGKDKHADWYLNLKKDPHATLQVKGQRIPVEARDAQGDEYARLWKFVTGRHSPYLHHQKMTSRRTPIVVFQPVDS